jgi:hypothetical protein
MPQVYQVYNIKKIADSFYTKFIYFAKTKEGKEE